MNRTPFNLAALTNGQAVGLETVPTLAFADFSAAIFAGVAAGQRVVSLFGATTSRPGQTSLYVVLAADDEAAFPERFPGLGSLGDLRGGDRVDVNGCRARLPCGGVAACELRGLLFLFFGSRGAVFQDGCGSAVRVRVKEEVSLL